ncbi:hypothetical protein [Pseudomonas sp. Q1-7]|uniref:hypothetical protein n=1 Tax=Pseudomonas sp. Q1-7 TaxID=3020843 RepID=UPI0023015C98|nr:hypothetical protein [Pseudomonas sp. Q1-7]
MKFSDSDKLACAQTVAAKAFFYSEPTKELKTMAYLVKGDLARIIDSAYGGEWLKVEFSKTKSVAGWLHASQAVVGAPDTCKAIN